VVAEDEQPVVGVEFLVGAGGELAHGNQRAAFNMRGGMLPRLAHVD